MLKNIIIFILLALLIGVGTWYVSQDQIKKMGNEIINSWKELIKWNQSLFENWKEASIKEVLATNGSILKAYWIRNISILLEEKNGKQLIREQLLQKILLQYWLNNESELSGESKKAFEKGLQEVLKNK